jgi:hypothetical protein
MSLQDAFALGQKMEEVDNLRIELARYRAALQRITELNPSEDSEEGYNEWGEADCFRQARRVASAALKD